MHLLALALVPALTWGQMGGGNERLNADKERLVSLVGEALETQVQRETQGLQDFTVALALEGDGGAQDKDVLLLESGGSGPSGMKLVLLAEGALRLEVRWAGAAHEIRTRAGAWPVADQATSVVVSVRRDPRQAWSGLWVNGVELASVAIPPGPLAWDSSALKVNRDLPKGWRWRQVDVYARALTRGEIGDWGRLAGGEAAVKPSVNEAGLVVLGGSEAVALMEEGTLEALFVWQQEERRPGRVPMVRSLAWEGDSVFAQDRPMNFGSLRQQLQRSEAGVALLLLGRQECLEQGREGVLAFKEALRRLVKECREVVPEVWLAGLPPFEKRPAPLPDLTAPNAALAEYDTAIREVAAELQAAFMDVRRVWPADVRDFTTDGINLNASGARLVARLLLSAEDSPELERLRSLARAKNRLWNHYWRPTNWAFLHGDRTAQPSSRDHEDPKQRWFPAETESYWRLIEAKENELAQTAEELRRKLP